MVFICIQSTTPGVTRSINASVSWKRGSNTSARRVSSSDGVSMRSSNMKRSRAADASSNVSSFSTRLRSANPVMCGKLYSRLNADSVRSAIARSSSDCTCGRARLISLKKKVVSRSPWRSSGPGSMRGLPSPST